MITDERLAELESGWQQEAVTHRGHPADEYANTCEDTAAALRELQAWRSGDLKRPRADGRRISAA